MSNFKKILEIQGRGSLLPEPGREEGVGGDVNGAVGLIDDHSRLGPGRFFDMPRLGIVHRHLGGIRRPGMERGEDRRLFEGGRGRRFAPVITSTWEPGMFLVCIQISPPRAILVVRRSF